MSHRRAARQRSGCCELKSGSIRRVPGRQSSRRTAGDVARDQNGQTLGDLSPTWKRFMLADRRRGPVPEASCSDSQHSVCSQSPCGSSRRARTGFPIPCWSGLAVATFLDSRSNPSGLIERLGRPLPIHTSIALQIARLIRRILEKMPGREFTSNTDRDRCMIFPNRVRPCNPRTQRGAKINA